MPRFNRQSSKLLPLLLFRLPPLSYPRHLSKTNTHNTPHPITRVDPFLPINQPAGQQLQAQRPTLTKQRQWQGRTVPTTSLHPEQPAE